MGFLDKAKDAIQGKEEQLDKAIDKAVDVVEDKTGHAHDDTIDKVADTAKDAVDKLDTADER